ncbi:MAG: signal recognition particle-docking protein FtsY [Candidatus Micrarchaeia archaeon]
MFDAIKKRISEAIKGFAKHEEKNVEEEVKENKENEKEKEGAKENEQESKLKVELGIGTKIKSKIFSSVSLSDNEINEFVDTLEKSLMESDVSYETAKHISKLMVDELKSRRFDSGNIEKELFDSTRKVLLELLGEKKGIDLLQYAKEQKAKGILPLKILFLGPNGTGKTTTIAKIAYMLKNNGITTVMAASDTFRAAAIEQTEFHANKLGVPVIKSTYGADPASIAFDAIAYAKAHGIDTVLIDSAGRQETNKNLIKEIEKMARVAKPDLTIYVGESISGNAIARQINEFSKVVKIDGIILTKLDCDAKGGGAVSISHLTGIPLLYFGTGEGYDTLVRYDPEFVVSSILPAAS